MIKKNQCNWMVLIGVLIITGIVFSGSVNLEWTNWDDNLLVYQNPLVQAPKLKDIFTKPAVYNTYNPLVILMFALEWKLVQDDPLLYHINNVMLHVICTALVWFLLMRLGLSVWWSGFAALIFGIHPMRVESVVWISERKDLLFGLFYFTSLLVYIRYVSTGRIFYFSIVFILFILSFLIKGQAVAMPLTMILLDWYLGREIDLKTILEKVIFFAFSIVFSILTVTFFVKDVYAPADHTSITNVFSFFEQLVLGGYAYAVYLIKSLIPYANSPLYPMPQSLRWEHWIGSVAAVCIFFVALFVCRKARYFTFSILFYTFNIFFLLMPFWMSETAFLFDHYTYVAYMGLFFVLAMSLQNIAVNFHPYRYGVIIFAVLLLIAYITLTIRYIPVWKNSETLWTYVIKKYPDKMTVAHLNRGSDRYEKGLLEKALEDFNKAIEINPTHPTAYANRSMVYLAMNKNQMALEDFNRYMELINPYDARGNLLSSQLSDSHRHRGVIYFKMKEYGKALGDFNAALEFDSLDYNSYLNRALTYMQLGRYEDAIRDFTICHETNPTNSDILNNRGVCYLRLGLRQSALDDFDKAIRMSDHNPIYHANRAMVYRKLGRQVEARRDEHIAKEKSSLNFLK